MVFVFLSCLKLGVLIVGLGNALLTDQQEYLDAGVDQYVIYQFGV